MALAELDKNCLGCPRHVPLMAGRAAGAAIYPRKLCQAVCRGVQKQLELDQMDLVSIPLVVDDEELNSVEVNKIWSEAQRDGKQYWDDVSGDVLDPVLTQQARMEEVREAERIGVWRKVPRSECVRGTCRGPIGTRFVDTNKRG